MSLTQGKTSLRGIKNLHTDVIDRCTRRRDRFYGRRERHVESDGDDQGTGWGSEGSHITSRSDPSGLKMANIAFKKTTFSFPKPNMKIKEKS